MSKYFMDCEFHEYHKQQRCLGIKVGKSIPTIDLISIGIVCEDGREYYAISKDFNIRDAWNSFQLEVNKKYPLGPEYNKVYWLRRNVLKPIFRKLLIIDENTYNIVVRKYCKYPTNGKGFNEMIINEIEEASFTLKNFTKLIKKYGKTNRQIAEEIKYFVYYTGFEVDPPVHASKLKEKLPIRFYAYYADYDWVVFCQLFGKMIDLPKFFPMYCIDLKQIMDEKIIKLQANQLTKITEIDNDFKKKLDIIKNSKHYPKRDNEHNALDDARWDKLLYEFLDKI